jgi:hypothetical protein
MVTRAEDYPYSSHRAYLGIEPAGIVDVDPVLRLFGAKREIAQKEFDKYVRATRHDEHYDEFDSADDGRILGSEEFVDSAIHRVGQTGRAQRPTDGRIGKPSEDFNAEALIAAVEAVLGVASGDFCGSTRSARAVAAKEALIVAGRQLGATVRELSEITGINSSNISRRYDAAMKRSRPQVELYDPVARIKDEYKGKIIAVAQA